MLFDFLRKKKKIIHCIICGRDYTGNMGPSFKCMCGNMLVKDNQFTENVIEK